MPLQNKAQGVGVFKPYGIHEPDTRAERRVMQCHHHLPSARLCKRLVKERKTFGPQDAAAIALYQRIKTNDARVCDICNPVDQAGRPYFGQVGKRSSERLSTIVIAGHHKQPVSQSLELPARNRVALGAAILTEIASDKDRIYRPNRI